GGAGAAPTIEGMSGPAIQVEHLHKRYGDVVAVEDVSFEVAAGEVLGLLGVNGADTRRGRAARGAPAVHILQRSRCRTAHWGSDRLLCRDAARHHIASSGERLHSVPARG